MKTPLTIFSLIFVGLVSAQPDEDVLSFNQTMNGRCSLEWGKKEVMLTFSGDGKTIRTDEFRPDYIDTSRVEYNQTENAVVLYCKEGYEGCFDRKIIKTKNHSRYSRATILVSNAEEADRVIEIWKAILREEYRED